LGVCQKVVQTSVPGFGQELKRLRCLRALSTKHTHLLVFGKRMKKQDHGFVALTKVSIQSREVSLA